jgi:hypothetical protein
VRLSPARLVIGASMALFLAIATPWSAQSQQRPLSPPPPEAQHAPSQQPANQPQTKAPAGPLSTHYPILLLVQAHDQSWSVRIGLKGPERLDRNGYPPIPLDPADVVRDGTADSWTYRAKDSETGAAVSVHIAREPCSDPAGAAKFAFTATLAHAQIGSAEGCARVATELFPKINNQPTDDDEEAKNKAAPPTVTHFKPPVAVAYINAAGRLMIKRGSVARAIPGKENYQQCLSHDGKRLLYTNDVKGGVNGDAKSSDAGGERAIFLYDWTTGKSSELLRGLVQQPFWSPDDTRIAFLKSDGSRWQLWVTPADAPEKAALVYPGEVTSLEGWADAQTILAGDLETLSWIGEDGAVKQTLSSADLYGKEQFSSSSANTVRIHPLNPDLLLVSAESQPQPAAAGSKNPPIPNKDAAKDSGAQPRQGFFLYEIQSKRRVVLGPANLSCFFAEWSRDGLQVFFTGREPSSMAMSIYKMFWDGTSQLKVQDGHHLVVGQ